MITDKILKLKKYLFLISILFLVVSLSHLVYLFLYSDSKVLPEKGGTVSEWLIWNFPSLNPLIGNSKDLNNKYIVSLLYRSLLTYNSTSNKIESDIANCDISNLLNIECFINDNVYWSNWEEITIKDIVETYELLKNVEVNELSNSLLQNTEIISNNNSIIFKNENKDINFLNIFFQPILSSKTINSLSQENIYWNFPTHNWIYSWKYTIKNISSDKTIWVTSITLDKNQYNKSWNIDKLILKIFPSVNNLLKNKELINIFNDNDNLIWDSIPRFNNHKYTLPQYVSLFINKDNIESLELRNYIFNKINRDNLLKILWTENFVKVLNPYLSDKSIKRELENKNFWELISWLWYSKKSKIIENYLPKKKEVYSKEVETKELDERKVEESLNDYLDKLKDTKDLKIDEFQEKSNHIVYPTFIDKYNFLTKDNLLLKWSAWENVEEVYINDYKLKNYNSWDQDFYYRLRESFWTITQWENTYKIYFVENWVKLLKEELIFLYYNNKDVLETEKRKFIIKLLTDKKKASLEEELKIEKENKIKEKKESEEKIEIDKELLKQLSNLNEKLYYNKDLEELSLDLYYTAWQKELETTANFIKDSLDEIWIKIELYPIPLTKLSTIVTNKESYDLLLTWINLWYFDYNIFPYFHSSQVKNWYNLANLKKTWLDILLEDTKSSLRSNKNLSTNKEKILEILKNQQVVKTLYSPKINLLIDKNIKNIKLSDKFTNKSDRKSIYNDIYIKEKRIINTENKWVMNFFSFLLEKLND